MKIIENRGVALLKQGGHCPAYRCMAAAARRHSGQGRPHSSGWLPTFLPGEENTMPYSELEIQSAILRLMREGYAALIAVQQRIVDSLMAVC